MTVESILQILEKGLSIDFIINDIKKSIKMYQKMRISSKLFKTIDISPFLTEDLNDNYQEIISYIARNENSIFAAKEKEISILKEAVLRYGQKHYSPKELESLEKQLSKLYISNNIK